MKKTKKSSLVRYGVVGLGHIAQVAVLPAFKATRKNSVLSALITDDPVKARKISKEYKVPDVFSYEQFDEMLAAGVVDALYICLPNHMHLDFSVRALRAGVHVLCEKPLALTEADCLKMHEAAKAGGAKLMTAYRLHFEEANLDALKLVKNGKLGELRYFSSDFSMQVTDPENIRLKSETGGGPVWDIGIYCINSARTLFGAEPEEVFAYAAERRADKRFKEVHETVAVVMRFPEERFANFTCSFGADTASVLQLHGTKGSLVLENAYDYATKRELIFTKDDKVVKTKKYKKADQFAPEILYFSNCVLENKNPEPDALEGMNDVKVIRAIHESVAKHKPVQILKSAPHKGPKAAMRKRVPGHPEPELVNAKGASS